MVRYIDLKLYIFDRSLYWTLSNPTKNFNAMIAISCVGPFFVILKETELSEFFPKACLGLSRKLKFKRTGRYVVIRLD